MHSFHNMQPPRRDHHQHHLLSPSSLSTTSSNLTPPTQQSTHLRRLRSPSTTTLRFGQSQQAISEHGKSTASRPTQTLSRLLLSAVPLYPSPTIYLSRFQPALNVYHSLLTMLAKHSLSQSLHNALVQAAVYPHQAPPPSLSPRDLVAIDFVRALASYPPRIPVELRTAMRQLYPQEKANHIALLASFGAYYSSLASLLGLSDSSPDNASCVAENDMLGMPDPSEMSAPSSINPSIASSARSFQARLSTAAKTHFLHRFANPLRLKLARHSTQHSEKITFLASVPSTRRAQDDFIRSAMGFTPEYLNSLRNASQRAAFVYIIDELLLRDSPAGIPTAVKNMACYILARSAENPVLTAHHAFLSNRFGATDRQLEACADFSLLQTMHHMYTSRHLPSVPESASSFASSDDENDQYDTFADRHMVRRRRRAARFRFASLSVAEDERQEEDDTLSLDPIPDLPEDEIDTDDSISSDENFEEKHYVNRYDPTLFVPIPEPVEDVKLSDEPIDLDNVELQSDSSIHDVLEGLELSDADSDSFEDSYFPVEDNPQVPDVHGLNAMVPDMDIDEDDVYYENTHATEEAIVSYAEEEPSGFDYDAEDEDEEIDLELFTAKEVAFLLLAHQIAQSWRRNSRISSKFVHTSPGPLLSPQLVSVIHHLFDSQAITEIISIIAAFNFLQRWTICYPYRPGALEAPVRRFVQTPIAQELGLVSVGQRMSTKQSMGLRSDHRSFRIPKHAVVSPPKEGEELFAAHRM